MWDNLKEKCPLCGKLRLTAPNLYGKMEFVHKVPSPRFEGYSTFQSECP